MLDANNNPLAGERVEQSFLLTSHAFYDTCCLSSQNDFLGGKDMSEKWDFTAQFSHKNEIDFQQKEIEGLVTIRKQQTVKGESIPLELHNSQGILYLLLISFFMFTYSLKRGSSYFKDNLSLLFTNSKLNKQNTSKDILGSLALFFIAALMFAIVCYEAMEQYYKGSLPEKEPFATVVIFVLCVSLFMFFKSIAYRLYGYVFNLEKEMKMWNRVSLVLLNLFGVICFIPVMILVFSNLWHNIIIGFVLVFFLLVQLFLFFKLIIFFISKKYDFLYLIVYLCTVELIPYVFLGIGLMNLYKIDVI